MLQTAGSFRRAGVAGAARRAMDLTVAGVLLILSLPVQTVIAVAVRIDSPGPAWFRASRVGRGGCVITVYKFRTMLTDATGRAPAITAADDPRITRVGRFLRRTKLDELPQLWNVLRGDMSLVGPRPEDPGIVARYSAEQRQILSIRPGITGPSQLAFRDEERLLRTDDPEETYIREILPRKLAIDLAYVRSRSLGSDARLLLATLRALVT